MTTVTTATTVATRCDHCDHSGGGVRSLSLREIMRRLDESYCGTVGAEFMHIHDLDVVQWVRERMETPGARYTMGAAEKQRLLKRLIRAASFETFLSRKWPGEKRFGLEGTEVRGAVEAKPPGQHSL